MRTRKPDELRDLYTRWRLPLLRFVQRRIGNLPDVEDLTQESFTRFIAVEQQIQQKIRQQTRQPVSIEHKRSYLYRIAVNLMHDHGRRLRAQGNSVPLPCEILEGQALDADGACTSPAPLKLVEQRQRLARLAQALAELPERQREAFVLHRFDGLTQDEVARRMNISRRMVVKHIARALAYCELRDQQPDLREAVRLRHDRDSQAS